MTSPAAIYRRNHGLPKGRHAQPRQSHLGRVDLRRLGQSRRGCSAIAIERVICVLPLFHIFALTVVLLSRCAAAIWSRCTSVSIVEAVMRDIEVKRATVFPGVPTMWIAIAALPDLDKRDFSSLRSAGSGGAPLPMEVARVFERKVGMKLRSGWGMTETSPAGTAHPENGPDKPGSVGVMLPGIEMDVVSLDDPTKVLPVGETGEIRIRGPNVTKGYWNKPKETAELSSATASSPATSATWRPTAISTWSTARRT
jgi:long-chain acyl-CoA synthetase